MRIRFPGQRGTRLSLALVVPPAFPGTGRQLAAGECGEVFPAAELRIISFPAEIEKEGKAARKQHHHVLPVIGLNHVVQVAISVAAQCFLASTQRFRFVSRISRGTSTAGTDGCPKPSPLASGQEDGLSVNSKEDPKRNRLRETPSGRVQGQEAQPL